MSRRRPSLAVDRADVMDFLRQSPRPGVEALHPDPADAKSPDTGPAAPPPAPARRVARAAERPKREKSEKRELSRRVRATFQLPASVLDQARDAVVALSPRGLTLTRLFEEALLRELVRLRKDINGGRPFPPRAVPPRVGRPVGR